MTPPADSAIVVDIDGTLCPIKRTDECYAELAPDAAMVAQLRHYAKEGFRIVLATSRNMRTYQGNLGLINKHTAPTLIDWLQRHDIPYDEVHFGKPWPGPHGFYVDDRTIRPREFLELSKADIEQRLKQDRCHGRTEHV